MYTLSNDFATHGYESKYQVAVIGCGGTGAFVSESLCRILPEKAELLLVDFDRVEERNLLRQNFFREDLGKFKSEALARRLSAKYNRQIAYSTMPVGMTKIHPGLVIGCVDSGRARQDIAKNILSSFNGREYLYAWWIDAGNGENYGQILIGNATYAVYRGNKFIVLPYPTLQQPGLLKQVPAPVRNCEENAAEQGPTINQVMASLVVEVVRRIIAGTCSWMQLYLDMENGTLRPVFADPDVARKLFGKRMVKEEKGDNR